VLEVDLSLRANHDPCGQFGGLFLAFLEALRMYWPEVLRTVARRGRRSRLERELAGLLTPPSAPPAER
jgi:hypothetical protein